MNKQLKMIWDFRGPEAEKIAEHHVIHLNEYLAKEKLEGFANLDKQTDLHTIAFVVVDESQMMKVRDELRPHRAVWYEQV
ncbi:hypothetical protein [Weeksella virosa]|uniref:Uncharacterized protein n=2 Tax=Weeksella TaxID=1013 RepID=F0NZD3_WEEVC|nr:hypothetical protein [Weeksella virosa]ADX67262.1 hypothetical protein Weevi_0543 [Weeksella virosa DSM 16922]MDK7375071.1 hypothetical protein [Weeksella virosa]MDK7675890.1 hypothetical protein [Weeksella virosa]OFM81645.1 hypothetical protein HMPREF2660_00020 [Weeksella sp. HMSC059D05]